MDGIMVSPEENLPRADAGKNGACWRRRHPGIISEWINSEA